MSLYDASGNEIKTGAENDAYMPFMSASLRQRVKHRDDGFDMSDFDMIRTFTPFETDYSTQSGTPMVLNISADSFRQTFYEPYLGYHDGLLVTKKNLGLDESGQYPIWCYDFIPKNAKRKILLSSGMHTYELPGSFGLARWIKDFMESDDAVFQYMRENVAISLIPIINPWGFNQNPKHYGNIKGVNPNRNFDDWTGLWATFPVYTPDQNEWNVKGSAPFSEAETRIIAKWLKDNTDAEYWIDCHTGLGCTRTDYGDVWYYYSAGNPNADSINRAADAIAEYVTTTYGRTAKKYTDPTLINNIQQHYGDKVVGVPSMAIEQATGSDTLMQTVPNNSPAAITYYALQIHAYVVSQLQG